MGGSVRLETNQRTTFIIANLCEEEEYKYGNSCGVFIVSEMWVFDAWENRNVVGFNAADLNFVSSKTTHAYFAL